MNGFRKRLKLGWDFDRLTERLLQENPELILISNELGYGSSHGGFLTGLTEKQPGESVQK